MTPKYFLCIIFLIIVLFSIQMTESRKVTQAPRTTTRTKPSNSGLRRDAIRNWARNKAEKVKQTFGGERRSNIGISRTPTAKPSLIERAKNKIREKKLVEKAVTFVKTDLGIGVVGPKKESKILKYGKKAMDKLMGKGNGKPAGKVIGNANIVSRNAQIPDSVSNPKLEQMEEQMQKMKDNLQANWDMSDDGTRYKVFEESKKWKDAENHCQSFGSNLTIINNNSTNEFVQDLVALSNSTTSLWIGEVRLTDEIEIPVEDQPNKCTFINSNGTFSKDSCELQLPFICQSVSLYVYIPLE